MGSETSKKLISHSLLSVRDEYSTHILVSTVSNLYRSVKTFLHFNEKIKYERTANILVWGTFVRRNRKTSAPRMRHIVMEKLCRASGTPRSSGSLSATHGRSRLRAPSAPSSSSSDGLRHESQPGGHGRHWNCAANSSSPAAAPPLETNAEDESLPPPLLPARGRTRSCTLESARATNACSTSAPGKRPGRARVGTAASSHHMSSENGPECPPAPTTAATVAARAASVVRAAVTPRPAAAVVVRRVRPPGPRSR